MAYATLTTTNLNLGTATLIEEKVEFFPMKVSYLRLHFMESSKALITYTYNLNDRTN